MKEFRTIYENKGAYHRAASGFDRWFLDDNYQAIARHCVGDRILDLGCGEGCLADYIDTKGIVGIDYSDVAIRLCRETTGDRYGDLYTADLAGIGQLGLAPASFDTVVCSLTLMYLRADGLAACLATVRDVLVPDGRFVITYPTVSSRRAPNPEAAELTPDALCAALESAGLSVKLVEPFCALVPKDVVERSRDPATHDQARADYDAAKRGMGMENSYHYLVECRKPA
jgi:SAM-dependent methyltransferase